MSQARTRYHINNWSVDIVARPWYIDLLLTFVAVVWMAWTFATIQMHGPSLELILPAFAVGVMAILMLYGHRITYLRIGDRLVVGMETAHDRESDEPAPRPTWKQDDQ